MRQATAKVADLIPYARNSRTHSDAQVAQVAASIREFGFTNPVLIDAEMRKRILPLARPYPKRADSMGGHASGLQPEEGGSTPTSALHPPDA